MEPNKVIELLLSMNFDEYVDTNDTKSRVFTTRRFEKRLDIYDPDIPLCTTNDKIFIHAIVYKIMHGDRIMESVTFELKHSNVDNDWFDLSVYGVTFDKLKTVVDIQKYIDKIVLAWKSVQ